MLKILRGFGCDILLFEICCLFTRDFRKLVKVQDYRGTLTFTRNFGETVTQMFLAYVAFCHFTSQVSCLAK